MRVCVECHHSNPDTHTQCQACGGALILPEGTVLQGRLRRYRVDHILGVGGFGVTYLTTEVPTGRSVVVKELQAKHIHDPKVKELFEREAQVLAGLDPAQGVPNIFDFFYTRDRRAYLVMEYVEGKTLADLMAQRGAINEGEVVDVGLKVLQVLTYLHRQGVIHRDVKPGNIMLRPDGSVALIDFGAVKQAVSTRVTTGGHMTSTMVATPGYAPPEQARGLSVDQTADLFGSGATLIHLLTGVYPNDLVNPKTGDFEWRDRVQVDEGLARAIEKATAYRPVDRYQSAEEMRRALDAVAGRMPVRPEAAIPPVVREPRLPSPLTPLPPVPTPTPTPTPPPARQRVPVWIWALGGVAVLALVMGIVMAVGGGEWPVAGATSTTVVAAAEVTSTLRPTSTPTTTSLIDSSLASHLVFVSNRDGKREVYCLTGAGELERVTRTPANGESWSPVLTPDGTVFFTSNRDGKREVYRITEGKAERVTYTPGNGESWLPVLTPGGTVLFTSNRDGKREVYLLTRGNVEQVTQTPGNGESWSPVLTSGSTVFFTSNRDGKREVYRITEGKAERVTYTPDNGESWSPVLTPGGIVLFTSNRDGKREVYLLTRGNVEQVTQTPGNGESWSPAVAPDGTVLFTSNRDGKREVYRITEGKAERVTYTSGNGASWLPERTDTQSQ